ncbi:hypothetical protein [Amycolatopsis thermophila]|uniref:Uncharacterized protein n=1 Tax=Amycolatopsis thermophila TaxID=206084 RepID=A0ABU0F671_9PSEU|nr:hypothetical protein [Amycolatopsis thermophila]MDQ0383081.1 hypothetical protein [Amycolatopsis thermophila]
MNTGSVHDLAAACVAGTEVDVFAGAGVLLELRGALDEDDGDGVASVLRVVLGGLAASVVVVLAGALDEPAGCAAEEMPVGWLASRPPGLHPARLSTTRGAATSAAVNCRFICFFRPW